MDEDCISWNVPIIEHEVTFAAHGPGPRRHPLQYSHGFGPSMSAPSPVQRIILGVFAVALLGYAVDYAVLRFKASRNNGGSAFGSVTVVYGTPTKDGRVEIFTDQSQTVTCVNSLFPHLGYNPCWYVRKNRMQEIGATLTPHPVLDARARCANSISRSLRS
jgi:hypothetical protein